MLSELLHYISNHQPLFFGAIAFASFLVISFGIHETYNIARINGFTAHTTSRSSHSGRIPYLGGVAVYLACLLSITAFTVLFDGLVDKSIIGRVFLGSTILVFVGIYDDLHDIPPRKKLLYQVFVSMATLVLLEGFKIDFFNLFGFQVLNQNVAFFFATFLMVSLINAFNFIDGIDGLCIGLSLSVFGFFGLLAMLIGDHSLLLLNGALVGALMVAFYKNVFSYRKMFLGDSGSFLMGYIISVQVIMMLSGYFRELDFLDNTTPVVIMALLSYPLVDSSRVILLRIFRGVSPFSADRNHIHHALLDLGFSHKQATFLIMAYTLIITLLALTLKDLNINVSYVLLLLLSTILLNVPVLLLKWKEKGRLQEQSSR